MLNSAPMNTTRGSLTSKSVSILIAALFAAPLIIHPVLAGPVTVETKVLASPAADPFVGFVSVGPKHEFEPVYRVLEPGACLQLAHRVLVLRYANYDNMIIEELGFAGSKCQDIRVSKSLSINGVTLGYALGEGTRFAWKIEFLKWDAWNSFIIRSAKKNYRISISRNGKILAEPVEK